MSQLNMNDSVFQSIGSTLLSESNQYDCKVDSVVHQLGSGQDMVYTNRIDTEEYTEWNLALFDGHGISFGVDPKTGKYGKINTTLLALQDMIETKKIDEILNRDIFGEEDSAYAMQNALVNYCNENKTDMFYTGATMVHVKVKHVFSTKQILVDVLSVGDSSAVIHKNGKKVLQSIEHSPFNQEEINRLFKEKGDKICFTTSSSGFGLLDANTVYKKSCKYATIKGSGISMAMTQSIGHLSFKDKKTIFGLAPYKTHMEFSENDHINIKIFSDGVSDVIDPEVIIDDQFFLIRSNATEMANFAKSRWEQTWRCTQKENWDNTLKYGKELIHTMGKISADDISCISWIGKPLSLSSSSSSSSVSSTLLDSV